MSKDIEKENRDLKSEVEQLRDEIEKLQDNLIHDGLTRLHTREYFLEKVGDEMATLHKEGKEEHRKKSVLGFQNISFLFCDIDYFKKINDTYGHDVGDEALKLVSDVLKRNVRDFDTVSRWGGEEIVVSLVGASRDEARSKAEHLRETTAQEAHEHFKSRHPDLNLTLSIGVAVYEEGVTLEALIKRADEALYKAKEGGRNRVVVYTADSENDTTAS
ncbi:MAG: GGDEF domain-containing protein [Candidatus Paceibacterota bacterium]